MYCVEKLCFSAARKFIGIFRLPGARITDQLCGSEWRQAGFSCDFYYPLVSTVRNAAQIANEIAALFKTEFFNTIRCSGRWKSMSLRVAARTPRRTRCREPDPCDSTIRSKIPVPDTLPMGLFLCVISISLSQISQFLATLLGPIVSRNDSSPAAVNLVIRRRDSS